MDILNGIKINHLCVSRGSTAIYLILKELNIYNEYVLVPANICYAAVYPIVYSGNKPFFCDVDLESGNVSEEIVEPYLNKVKAIIVPHMYGNPVTDIEKISLRCNEKNVCLIEDCASAMGATINGNICGSFGDYSIFSTGYSKTIDIGEGGIVLSNNSLERMKETYKSLPSKKKEFDNNLIFFSQIYRTIRNNPRQTLDKYLWNSLRDVLFDEFVHYADGIDLKINEVINTLDNVIALRREQINVYAKQLQNLNHIKLYAFSKGAVPWRFCIFVPENQRRIIIDKLLDKQIPVSDWYPNVTPIFGCNEVFVNVSKMENTILNFPLMISKSEIENICNNIKDVINSIQW